MPEQEAPATPVVNPPVVNPPAAPGAPSTTIPDTSGKVVDDGSVVAAPKTIPDYIPEKFHSAEDPVKAMAESYAELEKSQSKPAETPVEQTQGGLEKIADTQTTETPTATKDITYDDVVDSFIRTGEISDDQYKALDKQGLNKDTVNRLTGQEKASHDSAIQSVYETAGGQVNYQNALKWAAENFSAQEKADFDYALDEGNYIRQLAVGNLMGKFKAAIPSTGTPPGTTPGEEGTNTVAVEGRRANSGRITGAAIVSGDLTESYKNVAEYHKDLNSWEYKNTQVKRDAVDIKATKAGFI